MEVFVARCTICRSEFTEIEIKDATSCPKCGSKSVPCDPKDDVDVRVNWHELRILGIWAENWARQIKDNGVPDALASVSAITTSLEKQHPERMPLMLAKELREIRKTYPDMETDIDLSPTLTMIKGGE